MNRRTWQRVEQRTAAELDGKRNRLGVAGADVDAGRLMVECKARSTAPAVAKALQQAEASAKPEQLAVARIHVKGQRSGDDLVIMRWSSLLALLADK